MNKRASATVLLTAVLTLSFALTAFAADTTANRGCRCYTKTNVNCAQTLRQDCPWLTDTATQGTLPADCPRLNDQAVPAANDAVLCPNDCPHLGDQCPYWKQTNASDNATATNAANCPRYDADAPAYGPHHGGRHCRR